MDTSNDTNSTPTTEDNSCILTDEQIRSSYNLSLRIGSVFVLLVVSFLGASISVASARVKRLHINPVILNTGKFFGSGVVLATGFIHVLPDAMATLTDPCLPDSWNVYGAYGGLFAMLAALGMQLIEFLAHQRYRSIKLNHNHLTVHADVKDYIKNEQTYDKGGESVNKEKTNTETDKPPDEEHVHYYEEKPKKKKQLNSKTDDIDNTEQINGEQITDINGRSKKKKRINSEINNVENTEQVNDSTEASEEIQQTSDSTEASEQIQQTSDSIEKPRKKKRTHHRNNNFEDIDEAHHHHHHHHHHDHDHDHHHHDHDHHHHDHDHHHHDHDHHHHDHDHHHHDHDHHHHAHDHDHHHHDHHHHHHDHQTHIPEEKSHNESVAVEILNIEPSIVSIDLCEGSGHYHGAAFQDNNDQNKISTYLLELGIALHSVLIGLTLGTTTESFVPLFIALCFHQFFEAIALGAQIANLKTTSVKSAIYMVVFFALTTPVGIAIGIGIHSGTYNPKSTSSLLVTGILDSLSAGVLIYVALVNLITAEMGASAHAFYSLRTRLKFLYFIALYLGAAAMAVIGRWA